MLTIEEEAFDECYLSICVGDAVKMKYYDEGGCPMFQMPREEVWCDMPSSGENKNLERFEDRDEEFLCCVRGSGKCCEADEEAIRRFIIICVLAFVALLCCCCFVICCCLCKKKKVSVVVKPLHTVGP